MAAQIYVKACINGARTPDQHPNLPVTGAQVVDAAVGAARHAGACGLQTRIGMEDTLRLSDGSTAPDNAALVTAAVELLSR